MVVVALVAVATAGVSLSLPDPSATRLEREAQRLSALLESGRAKARTTGVAVMWQADNHGFLLDGERRSWLAEGTVMRLTQRGRPMLSTQSNAGATQLTLGPEPLMAPREIALTLAGRTVWLGTDGLRPFATLTEPPAGVGDAPGNR
jgi:general secretion pathway protein H